MNAIYSTNAQGWQVVNKSKLTNKDICHEVSSKLTSDARVERLKAVGQFALGVTITVGLIAAAFFVGKLASLVLAIPLLPLAIIPPVYNLALFLTTFGVGAAFLYFTTTKVWKHTIDDAKVHWNHAEHLYNQVHEVNLKAAKFN